VADAEVKPPWALESHCTGVRALSRDLRCMISRPRACFFSSFG
jgi:hypothetical protein